MARTFQHPGQRAELYVIDVDSGERRLVVSSADVLFEAPNWTYDGKSLVVNGDGHLFRVPADGGAELEAIPLGDVPEINNDHVLAHDDQTVYVSANDGHLYAAAVDGSAQRRITTVERPGFRHFLHGVSPDGITLVFTGITRVDGELVEMNIATIPAAGGEETLITDDRFADDGPEYSQDGTRIFFNSERASVAPGHAQLFSITADRSELEQLTDDARVNWFPHQSPDGTRIAYISFPPGTLGHPADVPVIIRILEADGTSRDLVELFGGQGTMNVPSWSPDGRHLAYVEYPLAN